MLYQFLKKEQIDMQWAFYHYGDPLLAYYWSHPAFDDYPSPKLELSLFPFGGTLGKINENTPSNIDANAAM